MPIHVANRAHNLKPASNQRHFCVVASNQRWPTRGGRVVRWCLVNFQSRDVLLIWIRVGQGHTALAVGAGGGCLDFFLSSIISLSFLPLWETARYRLKYSLKGPLDPTQPTNQSKPTHRCVPVGDLVTLSMA